jgi:hypothetical protein
MKVYGQLAEAQLQYYTLATLPATGKLLQIVGVSDDTSAPVRIWNGIAWVTAGVPAPTVTGTRAAPISITAAGGITPLGVREEVIFVQGAGGPIDITKNPQIAAGTGVGQRLTLIGCSDTNSLLTQDGNGLAQNGDFYLYANASIHFIWDGTVWAEDAFSGGSGSGSSGGSVAPTVVLVSGAAHAVTSVEDVIICTGNCAITLRAAIATTKSVKVKNVGVGTVSVARSGSDSVEGGTTAIDVPPNTSYEFQPDGLSAWWIF